MLPIITLQDKPGGVKLCSSHEKKISLSAEHNETPYSEDTIK